MDGALPVNVKSQLNESEEIGSQTMPWPARPQIAERVRSTDYPGNLVSMMQPDTQGLS
ncbi:hypothetical protein AB9K41_05285 [Cribrihabitans sp. XS_ASV171]